MAFILPVLAAVGTAGSAAASVVGGFERADADRKNAGLKEMQAQELEQRAAINDQLLTDQGTRAEGAYQTSFAATGREGGIGGQLQIHQHIQQTLANNQREVAFKARMLRLGAEVDMSQSSSDAASGLLTGAGTLLTGAASLPNYIKKTEGLYK